MGFEDLVLLKRLQKEHSAWVAQLVHQVFRRYDDYEKSVAQYRSARRLLLEKASAELV